MKYLSFLVFFTFLFIGATAQLKSRVIAFAKYGADTTIPTTDTGGYNKYSFDKGGQINSGTSYFDCDFPFTIRVHQDFETGYNGLTKCDSSWEKTPTDTDVSTQIFDDNNNIVNSTCYKFSNGNWREYLSYNYIWDKNNNLLEETDSIYKPQFTKPSASRMVYTYDSLNRITSQTSQSWSDSQYQTLYDEHYFYDNNNNINLVTGKGYNIGIGDLEDSTSRTITYTNNLPDSALYITFDAKLNWNGGDTIRYYFSPAKDSMITNFFDGDNYYRVTNLYDIYHNKISTTALVLDPTITFLINYRTEWSYNYYNQVTAQRSFNLDSSGNWIFSSLIRFYYETYNPDPPFAINNLEIYPSPTQNTLNIKLEWDKVQPVTFSIWNVIGQKIMEWSEPASLEFEQTISLPNIASGHYFIWATGGNQRLVKRFVIIN